MTEPGGPETIAPPPRPVPSLDPAGRPGVLPSPDASGAPDVPDASEGRRVATRPLPVAEGVVSADGFSARAAEKLGWYVYLLVDPRSGRPFWVGRGRGDRCFTHLRVARGGRDAGGRFGALDRIRAVEAAGRPVRIDILRHGLDGPTASVVTAAVAEALGLPNGAKVSGQRMAAEDVEAAVAKRARIKRSHPAVLLRLDRPASVPGYEEVRHGWRIGRRWTDPTAARSPRWAVIVEGELAVDVYRLVRWEPTPRDVTGLPTPAPSGGPGVLVERYSFVGERDEELTRRYGGRSVAGWLGTGPGPVTYVWCGPDWVPPAG